MKILYLHSCLGEVGGRMGSGVSFASIIAPTPSQHRNIPCVLLMVPLYTPQSVFG